MYVCLYHDDVYGITRGCMRACIMMMYMGLREDVCVLV